VAQKFNFTILRIEVTRASRDLSADELQQHLLHVWRGLEQSLIDNAVD